MRLPVLVLLFAVWPLLAAEHRGLVRYNGFPVPGAEVIARPEEATAPVGGGAAAATAQRTTTDAEGRFVFTDVAEGVWSVTVSMTGFAPQQRLVTITPESTGSEWELELLPASELERLGELSTRNAVPKAEVAAAAKPPLAEPSAETPAEVLAEEAADGLLINGSVNNSATSDVGMAAAFGNRRGVGRGLYNGGIGMTLDHSALDARPYSITGQRSDKAPYRRVTGLLTLGGPLRIPRLLENGPFFFLGYQWTRNNNATLATALMPESNERAGQFGTPILDPLSGAPFAGNRIPAGRLSPQALALLSLYPQPNVAGTAYNFQMPLLFPTHQDALQTRLNQMIGRRDQLSGQFALQSTRSDAPSVFGFQDQSRNLGIHSSANWWHRVSTRLFFNLGVQFSRYSTRVTPYFAGRRNVSGEAGITGNNQEPTHWGPPALTFASGIASLSTAQAVFDRNQTTGVSGAMQWGRNGHNLTVGGEVRRQQFNYLSQLDPRGSFSFVGRQTGNDFADFLLGLPETSSIAWGNADKYLRQSVYHAYLTDDWRVNGALSVNVGMRWEYSAPATERQGRLANLDFASGYRNAATVTASNPTGSLSGARYPESLLRPDRNGFAPRIGLAWKPIAGSATVIRAGYGVYYDASVYASLALALAQQPPYSTVSRVQTNARRPLTLANGFPQDAGQVGNTVAVDPGLRVGYAHNWQFSVQKDLPWSTQLTVSYNGVKGTRALQEVLPNTVAAGAVNPCPECPSGYSYLSSNGNSIRHAAQLQLRRRLRSGFTALLDYTFAKSIDNAALLGGQSTRGIAADPQNPLGVMGAGGAGGGGNRAMAQDWRNLRAERSLSAFDQRHVLTASAQYSTGMGAGGGALLDGWKGRLFKEWTISSQLSASTGTPQTPIYLAPVAGTGVTGTLRPDSTGAPLLRSGGGRRLNPDAFAAPRAGEWGNAGRNILPGPGEFLVHFALSRTFRVNDRLNLDARVDAANVLNRVNYRAWNTVIQSPQYGIAAAADAMRTLHTTIRLRF